MFIAWAMCGLTHVTVANLCYSCSLLCISNSDWATENEVGRSVSVNGNEEPRWRDLSPIQFSCNYNYSLITHNKTPVHSIWGLLRVCAAYSTPLLNLSSELRPSGNNIQDTFPTGSAQDATEGAGQRHTPNSTPSGKRTGVQCNGGWVGLGPFWRVAVISPSTRDRTSDRPVRSESLYPLFCL